MADPSSITPEFNEAARLQEERDKQAIEQAQAMNNSREEDQQKKAQEEEKSKSEEEQLAAQQRQAEEEAAKKKEEEEDKGSSSMVEEDGMDHTMNPPPEIREAADRERYNERLSDEFNQAARDRQAIEQAQEFANQHQNGVDLNNDPNSPKGPGLG